MSRADDRAYKAAKRRFTKQIAGRPLDTTLVPVGTSFAGHRHARIFANAAGKVIPSACFEPLPAAPDSS